MFIARLKTPENQISVEFDSLGSAINFIHNSTENTPNIIYAIVVESNKRLDSQFPDFSSCKTIVSMRTIK